MIKVIRLLSRPEEKCRIIAEPSAGSLQIHNAITGSLPRRNLNIFKEAFKLGNLIHEMNQVGQLLNVVRDVHFESEAAEKQQILILLNDRRAVCSGFNGRKWKPSKEFGILYEKAYIPDTFESRKSVDLLVENCNLSCIAMQF
ncbi:hypothetical protein T4B_4569 [Trichinella pseudospiralis]|uniref:Uncharacterized protein n=1 Tax=Trichinella pseudospiralis TaxID=6337 RepID=A0A0V1HRH0_TRIPS|nr:hypothetical protein T4B_4569 [Trichinella pseudospiralis]